MSSSGKFDVNSLRIASPCTMRWEDLQGDDRCRYCSQCKLNVYNVAAMRRSEVAKLVERSPDRLCMLLLRRADGTVITKDCPVGARKVFHQIGKVLSAGLALAAFAFWDRSLPHTFFEDQYQPDPEQVFDPETAARAAAAGPAPDRGFPAPGAAAYNSEFPHPGKLKRR